MRNLSANEADSSSPQMKYAAGQSHSREFQKDLDGSDDEVEGKSPSRLVREAESSDIYNDESTVRAAP